MLLAEHPTAKRKHLYLLGTEHAIRFLRGGRAMSSVLSRNAKLQRMFTERFGERFRTVGDYYAAHASAVQIDDVSPWLSELAEELIAEPDMDVRRAGMEKTLYIIGNGFDLHHGIPSSYKAFGEYLRRSDAKTYEVVEKYFAMEA